MKAFLLRMQEYQDIIFFQRLVVNGEKQRFHVHIAAEYAVSMLTFLLNRYKIDLNEPKKVIQEEQP